MEQQEHLLKLTNRRLKEIIENSETIVWDIDRSGIFKFAGGNVLKESEVKTNKVMEINKEKTEFLSRVSHELRTPLNAILGFSQLLAMSDLNFNQRKGVDHIMKSGKYLLDLVNDILDISSMRSEGINHKKQQLKKSETVSPNEKIFIS